MLINQVSGGTSGAITNLDSKEAQIYAIQAYERIRNNNHDVEKIAKNLNMDANKISAIKKYLFYEKYVDEDGLKRRFDPDFAIAQSWNRLAYEPENIQEHDRLLIDHEAMELGLVLAGVPQSTAHDVTTQRFNYTQAARNYYKNLKYRQKHSHKETNIDVETMEYLETLIAESNLREDKRKMYSTSKKKFRSTKKVDNKNKGGR